MASLENHASRARSPRYSESADLAGSGLQQENTISGGTRHPALGVHPGWRLHHQGSLLTTSQPTGTETEHIWSKVWNPVLWPKISTFLWLVAHNRTLTWDNLHKRGLIGPSRCVLCLQTEETKEHLFNGCYYSQQVWDFGAQLMRKSSRNRSCINSTIENWDNISFSNPILNCIWTLLPGFTLWQIWKERNKRIFHSLSSPPEVTWTKVKSLIQETVRSKHWTVADQQCSPEELNILQLWQPITSRQPQQQNNTGLPTSPTNWSPPPLHFIKANFDGASRGNPGPAGYGVVLRNSEGQILDMEAGFLGETTNNVAELTGLLRGLQMAIEKGIIRSS
jgi:hypothetical protein